jgi:hypothetical protein
MEITQEFLKLISSKEGCRGKIECHNCPLRQELCTNFYCAALKYINDELEAGGKSNRQIGVFIKVSMYANRMLEIQKKLDIWKQMKSE